MGIRSILSKPFASYIESKNRDWKQHPGKYQQKWLTALMDKAESTQFGRDHYFTEITNHNEYKDAVPIRDYEALQAYWQMLEAGGSDILWPGRPLYFSKTSGTTSGAKYIPISEESMPYHTLGARDALLSFIHQTGFSEFTDHKMIFLSGSPELTTHAGIPCGRLSGIVNHYIPGYLKSNQLPSYKTNCIPDWEHKLDEIVKETKNAPMSLISGIPPWVQMYFDRLEASSGKKIAELFPDFQVLVYGGVNFEPYKQKLLDSIGRPIQMIETYPASEGFIAYQDLHPTEGLLLLTNAGIFYEFIPMEDYGNPEARRLDITEVELNKNYALILSTNAGLWAYDIGDTVKFVSLDPPRIVVTGRTKHYISAFGEHVIVEEIEKALLKATFEHNCLVTEFTVAPMVSPTEGKPYHEWFVEFVVEPNSLEAFAKTIDQTLQETNAYYKDLITGSILRPLIVTSIKKDGFINYMKSIGKLGGQNKVPRCSNHRRIADQLREWIIK